MRMSGSPSGTVTSAKRFATSPFSAWSGAVCSPTFHAPLKGGQMVVPGRGLKPLEHFDDIGQVSGLYQAVVHRKVLDFCVHTHLACFEQTIRNVNPIRVGDGRKRDIVFFIKYQQRIDMPLLASTMLTKGRTAPNVLIIFR